MANLIKTAFSMLGSLAAGGGAYAEGEAGQSGDNLIEYPAGEARLIEATRRAQETMPRFLQLANAGLKGV